MFAIINYPGSNHHRFFYGSKKECLLWLDKQQNKAEYLQDYFPNYLLTDKQAFDIKYLDGNRVYHTKYHYQGAWQPRVKENGESY